MIQSVKNAAMTAATASIVATGVFVGSATAGSVGVQTGLSANAADAGVRLGLLFGVTGSGLAGDGVDSSLWRTFSGTAGSVGSGLTTGSLLFGSGVAGSSVGTFNSQDARRFYLDAASGLGDNWFDAEPPVGGNVDRPAGNTPTLAFGQSGTGVFSSNDIVITFNPGVSAFGFDFNDLDRGGRLLVSFNNGQTANVDLTSGDQFSGFVSIIASAGAFINSVRLQQGNLNANDGLSLYNFTTMAVVPLPPAAWAGLALLGGMAGARKLRRR